MSDNKKISEALEEKVQQLLIELDDTYRSVTELTSEIEMAAKKRIAAIDKKSKRLQKELVETYRGITELTVDLEAANEALRESENRYRTVVDFSPVATFIHRDGRIIYANPAAGQFFGVTRPEMLVGRSVMDLVHPENHGLVNNMAKLLNGTGNLLPVQEIKYLSVNGNTIYAESTATMINLSGLATVLSVVTDITERRETQEALKAYSERLEEMVKERTSELETAQEELIKSEKLSVLGRLTAFVSHELRNPFGVIRSSAFYLRKRISKDDEKGRKHLNRINEQLQICDSIVEELLEYTRGSRSEMVEDSMNPWVEEILGQINVPDQMRLDLDLYPGLNNIRFDKEKMRRVIINLVQNAIQAVRARQEIEKGKNEQYQPSIRLSTSMGHDSICLMVEDNGLGMNKETVQQAFEPLFTTRARGTGLGLAIVKKIVEEHGGTVSIGSDPERGTKVTVVIPLQAQRREPYGDE